jgi:hypothetical protein
MVHIPGTYFNDHSFAVRLSTVVTLLEFWVSILFLNIVCQKDNGKYFDYYAPTITSKYNLLAARLGTVVHLLCNMNIYMAV